MPKIIKNLNDKIIKSCIKLFGKKGYEKVEMKMIAKECGVAVGTLYNYYSSKWEIYSEVLNQFQNTIKEEIAKILSGEKDSFERASKTIKYIDNELSNNVALCEVFYNQNIDEVDYELVDTIKKFLVDSIAKSLEPLIKESDLKSRNGNVNELAEMTLVLLCYYKNDKNQTSDYINSLLKRYVQKA